MVLTKSRVRGQALDPKRVTAISGVILLHALVLAGMLLPREPAQLWRPATPDDVVIDWEVAPAPPKPPEIVIPPPPPPPILQPVTRQVPTQQPVAAPTQPVVTNNIVVDTPGDPVVPGAMVDPEATGPVPGTPGNLLTLKALVVSRPAYPRREQARGIEGDVELRVLVDALGRPTTIEVIGGTRNRNFELAAIRALKRWRFQPHSVDGVPQAAWARVPFVFRMD